MECYRLEKKFENEKAYSVSEGSGDFWIPKSQLGEVQEVVINKITYLDVEIPDWLAEEKGLI